MLVVAVSGMNDQAGRFVNHQQVVVFIDDVQRNVFGFDLHAAALVGHHKGDHIARPDLVVGLDDAVVHPHVFGLDGQLDAVAGSVGEVLGQKLVHAQRRLPAVGLQPEMLVHLLLLVLFRGKAVLARVFCLVAHRAAILAWLVVSFRWMAVPMAAGAPTW